MKMVNLEDKDGRIQWFNADHVSKIFQVHDDRVNKMETWIVLSSEWAGRIVVYGNIPSVIRAIENQIEFPPEADYVGVAGDKYGAIG